MRENRKFPRLDDSYAGELTLRMASDDRVTVPALITSVSPEGASVSLTTTEHLPSRGSLVTLRFWHNREIFTLPARVAWTRQHPQNAEVGLELLLDLTPDDMRQRYARWIVNAFASNTSE